jgi:dUTPase
MHIAQAVCTPVYRVKWNVVDSSEFDQLQTIRGKGGFGSTGV